MGSPLRVTLQPTPPQCDQSGVFTTLHILTLAMMTNIKFSHWFWITSLTIFFHCPSVLSTDDEEITSLKDSAIKRDAKSIDSTSHVNVLGDQVEFSTSRSVSVSHVRVEVQKVGPRLRKIRKISKQNKRKKMKKSFLENIYSKVGRDGGRGEGLMAWTNVIILGVSMVTVFALVSVLVVAVLYRRAKSRAASHCDQFSDILSTSSRSSASTASTLSTLSSGRSGRTVPDRTDGISFHSEGQLRKSVYTCEDLYSLDSDYFLSSLEDISVQI